jgi:hypothetical protein
MDLVPLQQKNKITLNDHLAQFSERIRPPRSTFVKFVTEDVWSFKDTRMEEALWPNPSTGSGIV